MDNSWGTGPVDMTKHCRYDDISREVSKGAVRGAAAVALVGLTFSYLGSSNDASSHSKETNSVTPNQPAPVKLRLPARPDPKSIEP